MWCDNCLLLLPLRAGAMAWATLIFAYSVVGGIFLFHWGQFIYFVYPEWEVYGAIGMAVAFTALINIFALSNRSYTWTRVCSFLWPFMLIVCGIRAVLMIVELQRGESNLEWECVNGGQLWTPSVTAGYDNGAAMPSAFCITAFPSIYTAFIISLLADIGMQIYMLFLNWRFRTRLEHYDGMKMGPNGFYSA
jgi:hypothetical protein